MNFTKVRLLNWKNFKKIEVQLEPRTFLVGPNAAGKSNFLDAFRFLSEIVSVGGGFQAAVERREGVTGIRCLAAGKISNVEIAVDIGVLDEPAFWSYVLEFRQDNNRRPRVVKEVVTRHGVKKPLLQRPNEADEADPERLSQTSLEQINDNRDFREVAEFFESIRYLHLVPQLVREPERSVGRKDDPFGGTFLEQLARTPQRTRDSRLRRIRDALKAAVPQLVDLDLQPDKTGFHHLRGKFEHWRAQGNWQQETQLSDGTLRLIGLLWSILSGEGPLLLEEPELSLHEEIVKLIPRIFSRVQRQTGRQIVVSTHADAMIGAEGVGANEVIIIKPGVNGSSATEASKLRDVREILSVSDNLARAVRPHTIPKQAHQLSLFAAK